MSLTFPLIPFPAENIPSLEIQVQVQFVWGGALQLTYVVTGNLSQLCLPPPTASFRADNLWQHTCFETFLANGHGYREINLSPSGQWQAYTFRRYREGAILENVPAPSIALTVPNEIHPNQFILRTTLPALLLPLELTHLGLSAVIEEQEGKLSYWALHHPGPRPDFHHANSFSYFQGHASESSIPSQ